MKVGFLTSEYPHEKTGNAGGIGTSIKNLAQALIELGHEVHILVYNQPMDKSFYAKSIKIHQIKNKKFKGLSWYLTRKKIETYINKLYKQKEIEIIEAPDWTGITSYITPKSCPVVIRLNGSDTYFCKIEGRKLKRKNYHHERKALNNADAHISVSQFTADKTNLFFNLNINFKIIPNGINTNYFQAKINTEGNAKKILYLGTLIRKKGLLDLPLIFNKVIEKMPNAKLILIGGDARDISSGCDSTWSLMKPLFNKEALKNTTYKGKVPYEEVQKYIVEADVCVFPSYAEALPVSWLEAMAMEKALVASNIGWGKEVIEDGKSGLLVHPSDHKAFSDSILRFFEDKQLKRKLEINARERIIKIFDSNVVAKKSVKFYQSVIESKL